VFVFRRSIHAGKDGLTRPDGKKMPDFEAGQEEVSETFVAGLFQQHFTITSGQFRTQSRFPRLPQSLYFSAALVMSAV